jgi:hypothetical protein
MVSVLGTVNGLLNVIPVAFELLKVRLKTLLAGTKASYTLADGVIVQPVPAPEVVVADAAAGATV